MTKFSLQFAPQKKKTGIAYAIKNPTQKQLLKRTLGSNFRISVTLVMRRNASTMATNSQSKKISHESVLSLPSILLCTNTTIYPTLMKEDASDIMVN